MLIDSVESQGPPLVIVENLGGGLYESCWVHRDIFADSLVKGRAGDMPFTYASDDEGNILYEKGGYPVMLHSFDNEGNRILPPDSGVCDYPQQVLEQWGDFLKSSPRNFIVVLIHVPHDPGDVGGWRWHKWGEYIGTKNLQCEYLAEEDPDEFGSGVYVFDIYEIDEKKL